MIMIMLSMIRGRESGTNFILRIKEQETRLTLQEHDDDDVRRSRYSEIRRAYSPSSKRVISSRRMRWAGDVANRVFVEKSEKKRPL
jgi:hypothetical protein